MKFILSTDSCCDGNKDELREKGISVYPMSFITGDEERKDNFSTEKEYLSFYQEMGEGKIFKTAGLNIEEMVEYFASLTQKHQKDVLHIALSSGLSCSCQNTYLAAQLVNETSKYKIYVVDSLCATAAQLMMLKNALVYGEQGMTVTEAASVIQSDRKRMSIEFFVDELDTLKRGGRISAAAAMIGKLTQVKPILSFDNEGHLVNTAKVIGSKRATMTLFNRFSEDWDEESDVYMVYGTETELCERLYDYVAVTVPKEKIHKVMIGPVIGSHSGSSIIGLGFLKK